MKIDYDSGEDFKSIVERGYDHCAAAYHSTRQKKAQNTLDTLQDHLDDGAVVLDVGCGAGVPVTLDLSRRFMVTDLARMNVPKGRFIHADIMSVEFPLVHFDAIVAYYSIFHLPREEHVHLFSRIHQWLKPGGYLMAMVGMKAQSAFTNQDFFGVKMVWSSYGLSEYLIILDKLGFKILAVSILGHGYDQKHQMTAERHPLIFAQKIA
jgi:cyclopropane fatty-acyl-phospholipid synthase-like methyltransferase